MALGLVFFRNVFCSCQKVDALIYCFYCPVYCCTAMSLQAFSFPVNEIRFLKAGSFIYNFDIIAGSSFRQDSLFFMYNGLGNVSQLFFVVFRPVQKRQDVQCECIAGLLSKSMSLQQNRQELVLLAHISFFPYLSMRLFKVCVSI